MAGSPVHSLVIGRWILNGFVGVVLMFLLLPTLIVIPMSLGGASYIQFPPQGLTLNWYRAYFADAEWMSATWFSLRIALATTLLATITGTLASFAVVRGNLPGARALQALTLAPLIVPHIVLAVALYLVFAPLGLTGNFIGFTMAHTMLSVPYVMLTVSAALQKIDPLLELAASNCGATRAQAFWYVVLPNIAPGVAAGSVFAFLASFDEATVAFFISGIEGKTITRKLFEDIDYNLTPIIAAVATVMVVVSLILMGGVEWLRSHGANRES
ncbi:ABC transporter permease [Bradyrhizobium iriomotense]|nr:ABC transporter permease [Bradyrhizobium iriomotense]